MPFQSKAQRRACYAKHDPNWNCGEWESETHGNLPEKKKSVKRETFQQWMEKHKHKKKGLKMVLDVEGEPTIVGAQKKEQIETPRSRFYGTLAKTNPVTTILYISDLQTQGRENIPLNSPDDVKGLLAAHPEISGIMFMGMHMPRRAVSVQKVDDRLLRKQFGMR